MPSPLVENEQWTYSPISPAPAAKIALRTVSASPSGTNPTSLAELDARRRQRLDPLEVERLADDVGEPAASLVEVGVRDEHGDAVAHRLQHGASRVRGVGDGIERVAEQRMVGEEELAAGLARLVERREVDVEGHEGALDARVERADLQPDTVPGFRQLERREPVDRYDELTY